jgi:hypothetical protein
MTDDQVVEFVNGCMISSISPMGLMKRLTVKLDYPAYELYTERLRAGALGVGKEGLRARFLLGENRNLKAILFP